MTDAERDLLIALAERALKYFDGPYGEMTQLADALQRVREEREDRARTNEPPPRLTRTIFDR